jgi:hypothetical protein
MLGALLRHEQNCVLQAHYYIGNLSHQARTGKFRSELSGETMAPADYGARPADNNLEKATRYLIHTSNSLKNAADTPGAPITASAIKAVIQNAALYDVRSELTLRDLHRRCVDQAQLRPTRATDLQAAYPSTGGAGFLLEATFNFARGIPLPPMAMPNGLTSPAFYWARSSGAMDSRMGTAGSVGRHSLQRS